ncbi:MAG: hypothetical protein ACLRIS_00385 [Flavonifractor plautii]
MNPFTIEPEELRLVLENPWVRSGTSCCWTASPACRPGGAGAGFRAAGDRERWRRSWRNSNIM